ncbi:MAG: peroxiredoxin family protein [Leptolyngbyaceae cyanobacterium MAG.088]|nr:peroxiredoxin family protein [Leptolyngbyaceae cyanobacterium MAG.088]
MTAAFKLTSMDFRGVINRRFVKNFLPLPALSKFQVGQVMPDFELPVVGQRASIKLSNYRNKAVVVIAFTRIFTEKQYCPFCYPHILSLVETYKKFEQLGAEVLMITSTDMRQSKLIQRDLGLTMPLLVDPRCASFHQYGTGQALGAPLPAQFVVDQSGKLTFQHLFSFAHTNASAERLLWAVHNAHR